MRIGPFELNFIPDKRKGYNQLVQIMEREKKSSAEDPKISPKKQLNEYRSWVSSSISLISDRVSTLPYKFYRKDTEEEIKPNIHSYKTFSKPFLQPNPLMSFRFIKAWCQVQLDLCGMACIYKAKNMLGQIWELWPLNMNDFMGIVDKKGMPIEFITDVLPKDVFYVFQIGGKQYTFSNFELVILNYPHPYRSYYGASPIQSQAYSIDTQKYIEIYERDFFYNSARVDMVLVTDQEVNVDKADEIKQRWREKYSWGAGGKFHDITVLGSGLKPEPLKFTNKDFEFMNLAGWTKDMVLSAYRINPAKLGNTEKVNRSTSVQVDIDFNRDCIQPRILQWDEELNKEILSTFDPRVEIRHDNPIPRDRLIEVQETRVFLAGVPALTPDEMRKQKFKLGSVEGGDDLIVSSTMIPLSMLKKYWNAKIKQMSQQQNRPNMQSPTDPSRGENDKPNLNPDGSDDRDDNPTPGRSFEGFLKKFWLDSFERNELVFFDKKTTILFFKSLIKSAMFTMNKYCGIELDSDNWIDSYSEKAGMEYYLTLWKQSEKDNFKLNSDELKIQYIKDQRNSNPRLAKICNSSLKSCINYMRFKYLDKYNLSKFWIIDSNNCGHKGRIKEFKTETNFKIGDSDIRFPGETFNLNCDCMIGIENQKQPLYQIGGENG
jgi:HK97 family phage portal protein